VVLTVGWFIVLLYILGGAKHCGTALGPFWQVVTNHLSCLEANEVGDFLAGAFAPVAFLWLAVAVFIQAQELKHQRDELIATREAATAQARTANAQLETLLEEKQHRERQQTEEQVFQNLAAIIENIIEHPQRGFMFDRGGEAGRGDFALFRQNQKANSIDRAWVYVFENLQEAVTNAEAASMVWSRAQTQMNWQTDFQTSLPRPKDDGGWAEQTRWDDGRRHRAVAPSMGRGINPRAATKVMASPNGARSAKCSNRFLGP
jgi:hypothetical protein